MAVTKRTRFEVLRRDQHTCQYCGGKAPDVTLQIDHVTPVALGGDDKPTNLVTACRDCNSGKSSIPPDSPLVQSLSGEAAAYALGMVDKMTRFREDLESLEDYEDEFVAEWDGWGIGDGKSRQRVPLPSDYEMSLFRWKNMGVPLKAFRLAIPAAMAKTYVKPADKFTYMAGIVTKMINDREIDYSVTADTAAVYTSSEAGEFAQLEWQRGHDLGVKRGRERAEIEAMASDVLRHHIDQTEMVAEPDSWNPDQLILTGGIRRRG